ncbi:unnamed protein product, partial [Ectocarpus sp. 12 AP-2014]
TKLGQPITRCSNFLRKFNDNLLRPGREITSVQSRTSSFCRQDHVPNTKDASNMKCTQRRFEGTSVKPECLFHVKLFPRADCHVTHQGQGRHIAAVSLNPSYVTISPSKRMYVPGPR